MMEAPKVSICCLSYNHEKYIRRTLDSFLMQKCDFSFEILIHDDASTDRTSDIIRAYEKQYPHIIRPIYQSVNQYGRGITNPSGIFNFPRVRGEYIALCEGDDYWTSCRKLQRQADFMDKHPDISFCFHGARVEQEGHFFTKKEIRPYRGNRLLSPEEVIDKKSGYPTASLFFRSRFVKEMPDYYTDCPVGDIPLQLHLSTFGGGWYMDRKDSVYRIGAPSSWSVKEKEGNYKKKQEEYYCRMVDLYRGFNRVTKGKYKEAAKSALMRIRFLTYINTREYKKAFHPKYRYFFAELPPEIRLLMVLDHRFPIAYRLLQRIYRSLGRER